MRTPISLDDDVAAKLKAETCRTGMTFEQLVNDLLRLALNRPRSTPAREPFGIVARDLGTLRTGLTLDNVAALAALAIEHGATLCTTDRDSSRFRGLRIEDPLR